MTMPTETGRYYATTKAIRVETSASSGCLQCVGDFSLTHKMTDSGWQDVSAFDMSIIGWFNLVKRDGSLNDMTISRLKKVFGWDGENPFDLEGFIDAPCQLELALDDYRGKTNIKVRYINPPDYDGGSGVLEPSTDEERRAIMARYGAKFRARASEHPVAPKPPTPAAQPTPEPTPTPAPGGAAPPMFEDQGPMPTDDIPF